ncbi:MAG: bifunctional phosphoribosylaminoimidazolecarboxamide formyltransferase/IMP cyclohydrolase [Alphaproteobacteria bacterium]|nr:bifunctional phosphoribosylaminoimidazolecarboxamide formyltransferase/IMP cyclohydrolase [Alphaproteobacteria bacterium]
MTARSRALLSVSDKSGLVELARGLAALGLELVASGGTARALAAAGLEVTQVDDITGHPEILGGRVKTLHPAVHGGILARGTPEHLAELDAHGIAPVSVVVCNLYPFERTVAAAEVTEPEAIEQIDIGGVALLRAAAKNFERVSVVCDPSTYGEVLTALQEGRLDLDARRRLALAAFRHTAAYDTAISGWLQGRTDPDTELPPVLALRAERVQVLRYGENSHQRAAIYRFEGQAPAWEQVGGDKELSYNNLADLEAAWGMPAEFSRPAVAIIKHMNPSGLAVADDALTAFERALACDPVSAFGGIVAVNRPVDAAFVDAMGKLFVEVLAAPSFTDDALELLGRRKRGCRLMRFTGDAAAPTRMVREIHGGLLVQTVDALVEDPSEWRVVTARQPTDAERRDLAFAVVAGKHVKSNAIVFCKDEATVGVGAGQMNRVDSVRLAGWRAGDRARGAVLASDAFFPFADGIEAAAEAGITAVVQPGGSIRDDEVVAAADRLGLAMLFTSVRHFRH